MPSKKEPCPECPINSREFQTKTIDAAILAAYTDPSLPNSLRAIAESLPDWVKADHKRVGRRLQKLKATGALPQLPEKTLGLDGKSRRYDSIPKQDEQAILQRASEIRQRQAEDKYRETQSRQRQRTRRTPTKADQERVICGNAFDLITTLEDKSVNLCLTSPPYANQRSRHYESVSEQEFPQWAVDWMRLLRDKLADDGSVLIVIRPHLKGGCISDYVLRTRLALREDDWTECEELIWLKPDGPPLGSINRPRRTWESILWFAKSGNPYTNLKACGKETYRIGFQGSFRFGVGEDNPISRNQNLTTTSGIARCPDVFVAPVASNEKDVQHPAVFPVALAKQLVLTFSRPGDLVLDCFCGSGSTLSAAKATSRDFRGFDLSKEYVKIALERLATL